MALRERTIAAFDAALAHAAGEPELAQLRATLEHARGHLDQPMRVAIVGHIKAGKSTMLNALLGADLAPTGIEELTFNVNWVRQGDKPSITVHFKDGRPPEPRGIEELYALSSRNGSAGELLRSILHVELRHPSPVLDNFDLVDTPGLKSFFDTDSQNTLAAMGISLESVEESTREQAKLADALLCLFSRGLSGSERSVVADFQGPLLGDATPITAIGVLTRCDTYFEPLRFEQDPDCADDPLVEGERVADSVREQPSADRVFYAVLPVCGLLGFGARTLTAGELEALDALARVEPSLLAARVRGAKRFRTGAMPDLPVGVEARAALLARLGQWGVWLAARLLREGASEELLRAELWRRSGLEALERLVVAHFGRRALLIKSQTGLREAFELTRRARLSGSDATVTAAAAAGGALEELDGSEPAFEELALLRRHYREGDALGLREDEARELLRVTGERGTSLAARLGLDEHARPAEMVPAAEARIAYWLRRRDAIGAGGATRETARVMIGAYRRFVGHALEAQRHLDLDG